MSVSEDFVAYLNSQTSITALVGNRICQSPVHVTEQLPYIAFARVGRQQPPDLSGTKDHDRTFLAVECRAATQDKAEDIGDALQTLLHAKSFTWNGRRIQGVFVTDQSDDYEFLPPGSNEHEDIIASQVEIISE
jgi:hypothetical protein